MYTVTQEFDFCYGHRLLNYVGKCQFLHGHNGRVEVWLGAQALDDRGMVIDFTDIKQTLRTWIDDKLDHQLLLHKDDVLLPLMLANNQRVFTMDCNPTAENIARLIYEHAVRVGLPVEAIRLWETPRSSALYRGT